MEAVIGIPRAGIGAAAAAATLLLGGCTGTEADETASAADATAAQTAVLLRMAEMAEQDLEGNGEPMRPLCLAIADDTGESEAPPPEALARLIRSGREAFPLSECHLTLLTTADGRKAGLVWVGPDIAALPAAVYGGVLLGGHWGGEFECLVEREGDGVAVGECERLTHF